MSDGKGVYSKRITFMIQDLRNIIYYIVLYYIIMYYVKLYYIWNYTQRIHIKRSDPTWGSEFHLSIPLTSSILRLDSEILSLRILAMQTL